MMAVTRPPGAAAVVRVHAGRDRVHVDLAPRHGLGAVERALERPAPVRLQRAEGARVGEPAARGGRPALEGDGALVADDEADGALLQTLLQGQERGADLGAALLGGLL